MTDTAEYWGRFPPDKPDNPARAEASRRYKYRKYLEREAKRQSKLREAFTICNAENRSTEYTIQFMQDYAKVGFDSVILFLDKEAHDERTE